MPKKGFVNPLKVITIVFILLSVIAVIWYYLSIKFKFVKYTNPSESMEPNISKGDISCVEMIKSSDIINLKRGDIVTYNLPELKNGDAYTKRIIALPGEEIMFDSEGVYINGNLLDETKYISLEMSMITSKRIYEDGLKLKLENDEYFILGDNRQNSFDSRIHGPVKQSDVIGKYFGKYTHWFSC